ncbi:MAG: hypothetical protein RRY21_01060, partial [Oscillospiraceae bacterium]
ELEVAEAVTLERRFGQAHHGFRRHCGFVAQAQPVVGGVGRGVGGRFVGRAVRRKVNSPGRRSIKRKG